MKMNGYEWPAFSQIAGFLLVIVWTVAGLYGAWHAVADATHEMRLGPVQEKLDYLVCLHDQEPVCTLPDTTDDGL